MGTRGSSSSFALFSFLIISLVIVLLPVFPASAQTAAVPQPLITQPVDESQLTTLQGNTYPLARREFDRGTAPASLPMERMLLVLKRSQEQETALRTLLDGQQDKASPSYHQWLAPEDFGKQFGPTDTDLQTITMWLQSHGFQVEAPSQGRTVIEFSGSASQVQEAFHTAIHKYVANGEQHWANASDPQIPTALTPAVAGIDSLHNFPRKATNEFAGTYSEKTKSLTAPGPNYMIACGSGQTCYAVSPYDFATIYDVLPLWNANPAIDGTGQTIAIVGRTNINPSDPTTFWQLFDLTVPANKLNIILNGPDPGINGDEGEADIDVQWSGAVAPQAIIDFVTSQSTETTDGVDLSAVYIVDNNLAPVMSESYGDCELALGTAGNQFYYALWEQAAAQGISVFVSTGDNGSAGCDNPSGPAQYGLNVNGLASTPFGAAVGGTDFNQYNTQTLYWNSTNNATTQESAKGYIPETSWNDSCTNALAITLGYGTTAEQACNNPRMIDAGGLNSTGGSGGPSNCAVNTQGVLGSCTQSYPKPSWQKGTGVPTDSKRDLPDVSLFASNGFLGSLYVICQQDATYGICNLNYLAGYGGTSVASPAFAGIMALVNQKMGSPQGVPGFALYQLATKQANAFHDVPSGSTIAMPCVTGSPNCTTSTAGDSYGVLSGYSTGTGYDLATGLGSVDAANLVDNWSKATFTASTTALNLNSGNAVNITHGTAVPVTIDVSPTTATGAASLLVSNSTGTTIGQGINAFTLTNGATAANATTSMLPGGSNYYVIAHYSGDGTYGGSYSTPIAVTVNPEASTTLPNLVTLTSNGAVTSFSANSATYGSGYYLFRVDVGNSTASVSPNTGISSTCAQGKSSCPTGTVSIQASGTALDGTSLALNSEGFAENQSFPPGSYNVTANYSGDASYTSSQGTASFTVAKAPTVGSAGVAGLPVQYGNLEQVDADISTTSNGFEPTGTFQFLVDGAPTGAPVGVYEGSAGYPNSSPPTYAWADAISQIAFLGLGSHSLSVQYSGDNYYASSTSPASAVSVTQAQPNFLTWGWSTLSATVGQTVSPTGTMYGSAAGAEPTGTMTFYDNGTAISGPVTYTGRAGNPPSGSELTGTTTYTFTTPRNHSLTIQYSGDTNYLPVNSGPDTITVTGPDFSLSPGAGTVTVPQGQSQTVAINISSLSGFTGAVTNFSCSGLPAETSCSFNPTTVTGGSGSTMLTITTTPLGQMQQIRRRAANESPRMGWIAGAMLPLLGIGLIGISGRRRRRDALSALMLVALVVLLPSCGGGSGGGGTAPNPVPSISSLSPTQQAAGSQSQALTIKGSGFISTSAVTYNGVSHTATYTSASQLSISLTAGDMAATGNFPVVVTNPAPGGGASSPVNFDVVTGTPTGSFTVTVTATSGALSHNTSFTLTVQ